MLRFLRDVIVEAGIGARIGMDQKPAL